jgi:hypothetical protein
MLRWAAWRRAATTGILFIYTVGCLLPTKASKRLGRFATLTFPHPQLPNLGVDCQASHPRRASHPLVRFLPAEWGSYRLLEAGIGVEADALPPSPLPGK